MNKARVAFPNCGQLEVDYEDGDLIGSIHAAYGEAAAQGYDLPDDTAIPGVIEATSSDADGKKEFTERQLFIYYPSGAEGDVDEGHDPNVDFVAEGEKDDIFKDLDL